MRPTIITVTALIISIATLTTGCESEAGAQFFADLVPQIHYSGPGGSRTFRVPASAFYSPTLKFKEAVVKNDVRTAARHIKPNLVEGSINGFSPIYYAAINGSTSMIGLLVRNGASLKRRFDGRSLAYIAASHGHFSTASELTSMGAGTDRDIAQGRSLYAQNAAIQRQQAAVFTAAAIAFLDAAIRTSSHSSGGRDGAGNTHSDYDRMAVEDQRREQASRGIY